MTTARLEERGRALAVLLAARVSVEKLRRLDDEVRQGRRTDWYARPADDPASWVLWISVYSACLKCGSPGGCACWAPPPPAA